MSLQLVTAIAQLASAVAIVPSLVFVGLEMQAKDLAPEPSVRAFWEARRNWQCIHFQ
jgi:hypothetical protein